MNVINKLKKLTNHNLIRLTSSGNEAIFTALYCTRKIQPKKKIILIPDQGGWITYKKYPFKLELIPIEVDTDYGIINLKDLKLKAKKANCLLYSNPAGYFAEQPVKEIYKICKENSCLVILDITGSIGNIDGKYADILVCSFGKHKPVNLGYGGFISTNKKEYFETPKEIFNLMKFDNKYNKGLIKELDNLNKRYKFFNKINKKIKNSLKNHKIIHKNKEGINVVVKYNNKKEKENIINYCKSNNYEYKICEKGKKNIFSYIKVNENAISIEVKRL